MEGGRILARSLERDLRLDHGKAAQMDTLVTCSHTLFACLDICPVRGSKPNTFSPHTLCVIVRGLSLIHFYSGSCIPLLPVFLQCKHALPWSLS